MNPVVVFYNFLVRAISPLLVFVARRWRNAFYLYLAVLFSGLIAFDAAYLQISTRMQHGAFDVMMRYRVLVPEADPDIVIVDIDEASLAALAPEYGRWPWPRQILGEFLERIETQQPRAVVFDILFSDPDVFNPDSDDYFDAAVAAFENAYFPLLRLDPSSDSLSELELARIPGVSPIPGQAREGATVAVVVPHFPSILRGGRLGLHNIYPDGDGVARRYLIYRNDHGWRMPSLPARLIRDLGLNEPDTPSILINWRGPPFSYTTVSFADVFNDLLSRERTRPPDEFTDKIVLIGSTAPSLFDIKPTPMSSLHPGVEILATAIDNLLNDDYLRFPEGRILYPLLAAIIVWIIALSIFRNPEGHQLDRVVGTFEVTLLASSYASINLGHTYINLTGPFTIVLAYYAVARLYGVATRKILETSAVRESLGQGGALGAFVLLIRAPSTGRVAPGRIVRHWRGQLARLGTGHASVDVIDGRQKGLWSLFEHTLAISWVIPAADEVARARALAEIDRIVASVEVPQDGDKQAVDWYAHEGGIVGGPAAAGGWRVLFADALRAWQEKMDRSGEGVS